MTKAHPTCLEFTKTISLFTLELIENPIKGELMKEERDQFNELIKGGKDKDIFCLIFESDCLFERREFKKEKKERYIRKSFRSQHNHYRTLLSLVKIILVETQIYYHICVTSKIYLLAKQFVTMLCDLNRSTNIL